MFFLVSFAVVVWVTHWFCEEKLQSCSSFLFSEWSSSWSRKGKHQQLYSLKYNKQEDTGKCHVLYIETPNSVLNSQATPCAVFFFSSIKPSFHEKNVEPAYDHLVITATFFCSELKLWLKVFHCTLSKKKKRLSRICHLRRPGFRPSSKLSRAQIRPFYLPPALIICRWVSEDENLP